MKCPKCGYLGFETTDRCRNCQYDFSLAPFASEPELSLQDTTRAPAVDPDFDLPTIKRPTDSINSAVLDLDRLFGDEAGSTGSGPTITILDDEPPAAADEIEISLDDALAKHQPMMTAADRVAMRESAPPAEPMDPVEPVESVGPALPFEDLPMVPPPAAKPPLAVRRATPEVPRNRPRTTRPVRPDSLALEPEPVPARASAAETIASLMETPPLAVRVGAGLIDLVLLVAIDLAVLYLTLRISGLQNTLEDLRVLPPIPFGGFLAMLAFGYVAAFTVAGGQTIGKMIMNLRVIGDDGRPVDAAGGVLRAAGCMLVPLTFGLSYVPALVTSDHRALHDRLAGTRVVSE
jgi:uncharacterized RDD family membrane protein YckC